MTAGRRGKKDCPPFPPSPPGDFVFLPHGWRRRRNGNGEGGKKMGKGRKEGSPLSPPLYARREEKVLSKFSHTRGGGDGRSVPLGSRKEGNRDLFWAKRGGRANSSRVECPGTLRAQSVRCSGIPPRAPAGCQKTDGEERRKDDGCVRRGEGGGAVVVSLFFAIFSPLCKHGGREGEGIEGEGSIRMGGQIFRAFFLPSRPIPSVFLPLHPFSAAIRPLLAFSFLRIPAGVGRRGSCTEADVSRRDYTGRSPSSSDTFYLSNCCCTFSLIVHVAPSVVPIGNFSTVCVTVLPLSSVEMVMVYSSSWLTMLSNTTS